MNESESITALSAALCAAQAEMPVIGFDATNPFLGNKFASLGAVIDGSRPVLAKHGLCICQFPVSENGSIGVESILIHKSGEFISNRILLNSEFEKGKSAAQLAGSVTTYLKRYSWASILGLYADEDNDGHGIANHPIPTKAAPVPQVARQQTTALNPAMETGPRTASPPETDEEKKARFLKLFKGMERYAVEVFEREGLILAGEKIEDISTSKVAAMKRSQVDTLVDEVAKVAGAVLDDAISPGGRAMTGDELTEIGGPNAPWRSLIAPFGKDKGARFGDMPKERLWFWVMCWRPEPYISTKNGKTYPPKESDLQLHRLIQQYKPALIDYYGFAEPREK